MAMRSHRRAYSYSQGAGVAPFWKLGSNSSAVSSENINTSTLVRATPERRSTGKRTFSGKGYAAVSICKPAAVKFAVNEDPWTAVDTDMSLRPRSPTKSRPGYSEMQQLDQSLAFIREQLVSTPQLHAWASEWEALSCGLHAAVEHEYVCCENEPEVVQFVLHTYT